MHWNGYKLGSANCNCSLVKPLVITPWNDKLNSLLAVFYLYNSHPVLKETKPATYMPNCFEYIYIYLDSMSLIHKLAARFIAFPTQVSFSSLWQGP
jgi:hypothetical protein